MGLSYEIKSFVDILDVSENFFMYQVIVQNIYIFKASLSWIFRFLQPFLKSRKLIWR